MKDSDLDSEIKQAEMLEHILAIGQTIQQDITENPRKVYQLIVETVCQMTGADCGSIVIRATRNPYHPSFGEFYDVDNVAACGLVHELQVEKKANKRKGLSARIHQAGEIISEDIGEDESQISQEPPFIAQEKIKAFMATSGR